MKLLLTITVLATVASPAPPFLSIDAPDDGLAQFLGGAVAIPKQTNDEFGYALSLGTTIYLGLNVFLLVEAGEKAIQLIHRWLQ